ncbi:HAD family hydrolase [Zafaria sp. Z1313]|uniref:HAD family hydrolase n=1 Tax=unclassified Zafaria TaxID=2828765 RepID=UPI002E77CEA7|nr:HAD family hydrolase [Zafaria sp. J156]MEE1621217.1 HAD family hydrolase [Zafaria sp. J156]
MPSNAPAGIPNAFDHDAGLQAVLWDMDGTIVDTEPYWIAAEQRLVAAHGGSWSHEDGLRLVGQALPTSAGMLQEAGVGLGIREIIDELTGAVAQSVTERVPWRPGARELLADLRRHGVPCALVTMSEGPLARIVAAALPEDTFSVVVTGDMVERGKPDPEPYLRAMELLEAVAGRPVAARMAALEDSAPGVASAHASGAATVAVPHITALPDGGWTVWETLAGRTAADLDALVRSRAAGAAPGTAAGSAT